MCFSFPLVWFRDSGEKFCVVRGLGGQALEYIGWTQQLRCLAAAGARWPTASCPRPAATLVPACPCPRPVCRFQTHNTSARGPWMEDTIRIKAGSERGRSCSNTRGGCQSEDACTPTTMITLVATALHNSGRQEKTEECSAAPCRGKRVGAASDGPPWQGSNGGGTEASPATVCGRSRRRHHQAPATAPCPIKKKMIRGRPVN